ncbi:hypothetical protein [Nocardia wallacei]|uniref:hypothetical protein n=1 Tax=Nocardia wallacei TaxID=480035 RepID=UPI002453988D|nr:hypothetical protein [Nocardia wallacei]
MAITADAIIARETRTILGIDADTRLQITVTHDGWEHATCEETGQPGAVEVKWSTWDDEDGGYVVTDRTLAADIAGAFINTLLMSDRTNPHELIEVGVCAYYLRFVHAVAA